MTSEDEARAWAGTLSADVYSHAPYLALYLRWISRRAALIRRGARGEEAMMREPNSLDNYRALTPRQRAQVLWELNAAVNRHKGAYHCGDDERATAHRLAWEALIASERLLRAHGFLSPRRRGAKKGKGR